MGDMTIKHFRTLAFIGAIILMGCVGKTANSTSSPAMKKAKALSSIETASGEETQAARPMMEPEGIAGRYLSSHFAQSQYDWDKANQFIGEILEADPGNIDLVRRSMILAMGSGDIQIAAQRAQELLSLESEKDGLALMILSVKAMAEGQMQESQDYLDQMAASDMTDFVRPILKGWAQAASGELRTEGFNDTAIHNYHGALLATYLDKKEEMTRYTNALIEAGTLSDTDAQRAADMLAVLGRMEEAATLYEGLHLQDSSDKLLADKLAAAKAEKAEELLNMVEPLDIKTPQQGAALAMYDMAYILYQEHSDSSTKLFAHMALALNPQLTDAHLLLADTMTRNGRFEDAITQLGNVPPGHPSYLTVQRYAAELLAETGRYDEALEKLNRLFTEYNDVESLIRIGDLHRGKEDYRGALTAYNEAAKHIGNKIPEKYWYLLYARGMAYEREGDWTKAESDLKAALGYRPDHPYLLNYLGYGWADQGMNLEESLELIKRAVALRPADGYILDSLGWVQFMMQDYDSALATMERAVELLPYDSTVNDHLGDVYWRVGRQNEARFQWERALNYSEADQAGAKEKLRHKLRYGLNAMETVKEAAAAQ